MAGHVSIANEAMAEFIHGHGVVGGTSAALASAETPVKKYVIIKADLTNTDNVYVGGPAVTTGNGFELDAGESTPPIHINDLSKVWVVGGAASQGYSWLAI